MSAKKFSGLNKIGQGDYKDAWNTPFELIYSLGVSFDLDPCGNPTSCDFPVKYMLEAGQDGLALPWRGTVWCNPPFSQKEAWIDRMIEHNNGVLLLPASTSAHWWHRAAAAANEIIFLKGRVQFSREPGKRNPAGTTLFLFGRKVCLEFSQGKTGAVDGWATACIGYQVKETKIQKS